jgi:Tfp pilus assembly protein PilF
MSLNGLSVCSFVRAGRVAEQMNDLDRALQAYERALEHVPTSISAYTQAAGIARVKENYPKVRLFPKQLCEDLNSKSLSAC